MILKIILFQLLLTAVTAVAFEFFYQEGTLLAALYGGLLVMLLTILLNRSTDKAMSVAVTAGNKALVVLYFGVVLRYGLVLLGLVLAIKVLLLEPTVLAGSFVVVQSGTFFILPVMAFLDETVLRETM